MAPLRRLASLAVGITCCMAFTSSASAQDAAPTSVDMTAVGNDSDRAGTLLLSSDSDAATPAAASDSDSVGSDASSGGDVVGGDYPVLGGWPTMAIGDSEITFLVQVIGNQSYYNPALSSGLCMKDVSKLQYQSVAGTNFRYQGRGCLVQLGSTAMGACAAECAVEQLQVTIFTQEWTKTIEVSDIARIQ